jgi:plasmid stabilization system protein ParE
MNYSLTIRPEAEQDLAEAFRWYEDRRAGLGVDFFREVDAVLAAISDHPKSVQVIYQNVRRALTQRFPYGIFFVLEKTQITVIAVFHAKRDPNSWQRRI